MKRLKQITAGLIAALMLPGASGCNSGDSTEVASANASTETFDSSGAGNSASSLNDSASTAGTDEKLPPLKLSIVLNDGSNDFDNLDVVKQFRQAIEEYTKTEIEWIWYATEDLYTEKITLLLASGNLPSIFWMRKDASFISAVQNDMFWDVTDYVYNGDYPNLEQISETVFLNASVNGRLYSIPRSRTLARNGVGYRLDWLINLGLKEPETIDDFYDMLVAFTKNDPDGNNVNDTYGLGMSEYTGSWDIMQLWFGAPNGWGIDENGDLEPAHLTEEYDTALRWFRKIYSEGLINPDFRDYPSSEWDTLFRSEIAGAGVDVLDRFRRNQTYFESEGSSAETMLIGGFDAGYGLRVLPTAGYNGMLVISKSAVKTEEEFVRTLEFLDKVNDGYMCDLLEKGLEGYSYYINEEGYLANYTEEEKIARGITTDIWNAGYANLLAKFNSPEELVKRIPQDPHIEEIQLLEEKLYEDNIEYCIPNYGAPYTSATYTEVGNQLDEIIESARLDYITGVIDDTGLQEAKDQWRQSGGNSVIAEMNELYHGEGN